MGKKSNKLLRGDDGKKNYNDKDDIVSLRKELIRDSDNGRYRKFNEKLKRR